MNDTTFISVIAIREAFGLGTNITDKQIHYFILREQEASLEYVLSTDLYNKLIGDIEDDALCGEYRTLVDEYIAKYLIELVGTVPSLFSREDRDVYKGMHHRYMTFYRRRLIFHLKRKNFPEYKENSPVDGITYPLDNK